MNKVLIQNTWIYIAIGFLAQVLIFFLWIVLAWKLTPQEFGHYALAMFVVEFFSMIGLFGLSSTITRFYSTEKDRSSVLSNALAILFAASLLTVLVFIGTVKFIPIVIPGLLNLLEEHVVLFSAVMLANSLASFILVHYTAVRKAVFYAELQLLKITLFCAFSIVFVYLGFGIMGVFYALLVSSLAVIFIFLFREGGFISLQKISYKALRPMLSYTFPLMLFGALGVITDYLGRILLDRHTDVTSLGVYSFFLVLILQLNGLWGSFNRAWTPEIFSQLASNREKAMEQIKFMAFFSSFAYLFVLIVFLLLGKIFLFQLLFQEVYRLNIHLFYILLLVPLFSGIYTALYPLYYFENKTSRILLISIFLSVVTVAITFYMVKFFGATGAAISPLIMAILALFIYPFVFKKIVYIPQGVVGWSLLLSTLMLVSVFLLLKTSSFFLFLLFLVFGAVFAYQMGHVSSKKDMVIGFLKKITNKTLAS